MAPFVVVFLLSRRFLSPETWDLETLSSGNWQGFSLESSSSNPSDLRLHRVNSSPPPPISKYFRLTSTEKNRLFSPIQVTSAHLSLSLIARSPGLRQSLVWWWWCWWLCVCLVNYEFEFNFLPLSLSPSFSESTQIAPHTQSILGSLIREQHYTKYKFLLVCSLACSQIVWVCVRQLQLASLIPRGGCGCLWSIRGRKKEVNEFEVFALSAQLQASTNNGTVGLFGLMRLRVNSFLFLNLENLSPSYNKCDRWHSRPLSSWA